MKKIELVFGTYFYRYSFDIDTQTDGIDIYTEGENYIGRALLDIPDEEDEDFPALMEKFTADVEEWIIDNE